MAIDKALKELASAILKRNDIDHDRWLTEKYTDLILENASILKAGIEQKETKNEVKNNAIQTQVNLSKDRPWEQNK
ncbi:hypothetical protein [Terrisporobacter muris]|uniref:Uncharacterized protein n=1 Tax=Terrisporobacter muris TaxID=2963284 RepID=A0A9X2M7W1_9FIRM|nr:hypothetical protein [Terrisporobacter muris]MCR1821883.1 hypothetical protein [Terrisporobacter muris]